MRPDRVIVAPPSAVRLPDVAVTSPVAESEVVAPETVIAPPSIVRSLVIVDANTELDEMVSDPPLKSSELAADRLSIVVEPAVES